MQHGGRTVSGTPTRMSIAQIVLPGRAFDIGVAADDYLKM
jgi:hypothetical protein